jgi:glucose/arabinose dehydrogenase
MRLMIVVFGMLGGLCAAQAAGPEPASVSLPPGWSFRVYAEGLSSPRLMQMAPDGSLLVSTYQAGEVALLQPDGNGDGRSDGTRVLVSGLNLPHGLWLEADKLYVAEEGSVSRYDFDGVVLSNRQPVLTGLPTDGGHSSRTVKRGPDGWLYVSVGSSCNVCIESNDQRAAMLRVKEGQNPEIFARGLRNTVGFDWQPSSGALYGVDNGRDMLGDDIPDDELNLIVEGRHYGWPFAFNANEPDPQFGGRQPKGLELTALAHGFGAHVAPLSITFLRHQKEAALNGRALVAEHGSWNRSQKAGYRVVMLEWKPDGQISESVFFSGCLKKEKASCRPVDILEGPDGTIYVSDDKQGAVYALSPP